VYQLMTYYDRAGAQTTTVEPLGTPTPDATPTSTPWKRSDCPSKEHNVPDGRDPWGGCFPGPKTTGVPEGVAALFLQGVRT